jgi:hypothetical protein
MVEAVADSAIKGDGPEPRGRPKRNAALCPKTVSGTDDLGVKLRSVERRSRGLEVAATRCGAPHRNTGFECRQRRPFLRGL